MTFAESVKKTLTTSYADFSGRAPRSEFWWFVLFAVLVIIVAAALDGAISGSYRQKPIFYFIASVLIFLPGAGLGWRRIVDVGLPGWLSLIPSALSALYLLVLAASLMDGEPLEEEAELGWLVFSFLVMVPFIIIWCLPSGTRSNAVKTQAKSKKPRTRRDR